MGKEDFNVLDDYDSKTVLQAAVDQGKKLYEEEKAKRDAETYDLSYEIKKHEKSVSELNSELKNGHVSPSVKSSELNTVPPVNPDLATKVENSSKPVVAAQPPLPTVENIPWAKTEPNTAINEKTEWEVEPSVFSTVEASKAEVKNITEVANIPVGVDATKIIDETDIAAKKGFLGSLKSMGNSFATDKASLGEIWNLKENKKGVAFRSVGILASLGVAWKLGTGALKSTKLNPQTLEAEPVSFVERGSKGLGAVLALATGAAFATYQGGGRA